MGRRSVLDRSLVPLLALLLLGASAAAPSPEQQARRAARTALDRADLAGAEKIIDDALARFAGKDSEAVWALRVLRGEALISRGDHAGARKALALELPPRYARSATAVTLLVMRAYAGEPTIDAARELAAAHQPAMLVDVSLFLARRGEAEAREAMRLARKYKRRDAEAKATASLAYILAGQGQFAESVQWGDQALAIARSLGLVKTVQQIEGNLGWAYFELGDYETAAELFTSAERIAARAGAQYDRVAWLIQLGNVRHQERKWAEAFALNQQAASLGVQRIDVGYALANLARISLELGRFEDARKFNDQALVWKREFGDTHAELESYIVDARIATVKGDAARAEKLLTGVIRGAKRISTRMEAESRLAQLYARLRRDELATRHFELAVQAAREARGEVKDRDLRFSFFNSVRDLFGAYVDFLASRGRAEDALAVTEASRAQILEEELKIAPSRKLDARAIARQNDATILCYWLGRDRSYLWAITPSRVTMHLLPADTLLEKTVDAYRRDLLGVRGSLQQSGARGQELHRMLVQRAEIAKGSRVIVVADGKLHTLNFETLVAPSPQRYWIEDVVVQNAGSLQLLARAPAKSTAAPSILLVGNAPSPDRSFPALPHAAAEMQSIAARFPRRTVLEGAAATPAAYHKAAPGKFEYVHFVAHGVATRKRPLDSAVILARDAASKSYKLLAREVLEDPLTARLVTISSCHGAGTRTYAGEGVVGLAWAFLSAGADQVIAALWEVNDASTPQLMDQMYAGIRAGRTPEVALRDAKLKLVRAKNAHRMPRYWAPFVLYAGT